MEQPFNLTKLDFTSLNSKELDFLKTSNDDFKYDSPLVTLFNGCTFPYIYSNIEQKKKEVRFTLGYIFSVFSKGKPNAIRVNHRNRTGYLFVDNGYLGSRPYGKDYYAIIKVRPDFSNEAYVSYVSVLPKVSTDFNTKMLDTLAEQVIDVWDKAIENNARNWG